METTTLPTTENTRQEVTGVTHQEPALPPKQETFTPKQEPSAPRQETSVPRQCLVTIPPGSNIFIGREKYRVPADGNGIKIHLPEGTAFRCQNSNSSIYLVLDKIYPEDAKIYRREVPLKLRAGKKLEMTSAKAVITLLEDQEFTITSQTALSVEQGSMFLINGCFFSKQDDNLLYLDTGNIFEASASLDALFNLLKPTY